MAGPMQMSAELEQLDGEIHDILRALSCLSRDLLLPKVQDAKEFDVFCIYDTCSLSKVQSENFKLLQMWMTQGR